VPATAFHAFAIEGASPQRNLDGGLMGDLNGDRLDDLVLHSTRLGEVYILFGTDQLLAEAELPAAANVIIRGVEATWSLEYRATARFPQVGGRYVSGSAGKAARRPYPQTAPTLLSPAARPAPGWAMLWPQPM